MSEKYEFLDNSINFMEQFGEYEQYEETSQFNENLIASNHEKEGEVEAVELETTHEQNLQNETVTEEPLEDEISTVRYQEVDTLIRHEIKEVIHKKESEKTTLAVLSEQKNIIFEEIKRLQNLTEDVGQETEELNVKVETEKAEMLQLQKQVLYNGEITEKLEGFMKTIADGYKQLERRNQQMMEKAVDQNRQMFDMENEWKRKIFELKFAIDSKKSSIANTGSTDDLKQKNLRLKAEVLKRREHLEKLKVQRQEIDRRKEGVKILRNEKQQLEETLKDLNLELQRTKDIKDQTERELDERTKELDLEVEDKRNKLNASIKTADELKNKIQESNEEYGRLVSILVSKEQRNAKLDEEKEAGLTTLKELKKELEVKAKKWQQDIEMADKKLEESENKLTTMVEETTELNCCLETLKKQYITTIEKKNEKLLLKVELEEKLKADEVMLEKIKLLDEKIAKRQKAIDELSQNIEGLSVDERLMEMEKKKAYLASSTDYLTEKNDNLKKQVDDVEIEVEKIKEIVVSNKKSIEEKQEVRDNLLKELQELKNSTDMEESSRTPPSILKSPLSQKKFPISPKKVQFEGISSYESSGSSEHGTRQQSIADKSFDEILEEINAGIFKQPTKTAKKRKLEFQ